MENNKEQLSSILKTTQMGQIGIRSALNTNVKPELRSAMVSQLKEYDSIETEAHTIAKDYHWDLPELNPSIRMITDRVTQLRLSFGDSSSKIAAMMIRGNISGIIKTTQRMHRPGKKNTRIMDLSNKLNKTQSANIDQMKPFL